MMYGRAKWQEAEATRKDFNSVLIRQDKKFFTFELFKVIQDAVPLILHYRTMCWFRTISSSTFIILDMQSIYTPSQIQDWYREDKINSSRNRQTVFFTAVNPMHKNHQDPVELDLTKPRLASFKKEWKRHQDTVERSHPLRHIPSLLYPESCCDGIWRSQIRESVCHLNHRRRFLIKITRRVIWILMLQEAVKTSNESK